ncbi:hypothetical protein [Brevundimonas sp.]|jgi:hypothetical protein|uniref:hypothetical protein n=1 Tax=Brevundimonas sp. TaxID=1871086 RepID=UPI00378321B5
MEHDSHLQAISIDLAALRSIVLGLSRAIGGRSPGDMADVLEALSIEADRLRQECGDTDSPTPAGAGAVVRAYIDSLTDDASTLSRARQAGLS